MTPLFIILVLLHILYIILGYMFSMSTFFFAIGSTISLLYTGTYRLSLELLLTNLSLILIGYVMIEYFQNGSFTPNKI